MRQAVRGRTGRNLSCRRPIALQVKVGYFLSEQTLQKCFPQRVGGPGSGYTKAECGHVANDKPSNEQIDKVEHQVVNATLKLARVSLTYCITIE
jgi:hypothetical protein